MIKNDAVDIIRDAGYGFLATSVDNEPFVRPMMPFLTEDDQLLLALLKRSRTISQIQKNPKIEFCFVDRRMSYCRIKGDAFLSMDLEKKSLIFNGIPMLRQYFFGADDPNLVLVQININSAEVMTVHQKTPTHIPW